MNETLMRVVLEQMMFIALCSEDVLDLDDSAMFLENTSSMLGSLHEDERVTLFQFAELMALTETNQHRRDFLRNFREDSGL